MEEKEKFSSKKVSRRDFLKRSGQVAAGAFLASSMFNMGTNLHAGGKKESAQEGVGKTQGFKILLSLPTANNIYFAGWIAATKAAAEALGMQVHYENFEFDNARQLASFQNMPNLGIVGVSTSVNSAAMSPKLMRICQEQKVYAVNGWSNQPWYGPVDMGDYYATYMETDTDTGFDAMCTYLFEKMGGKGKVIHISGIAGNLCSNYRDFGVDRALAKFPKIQLVGREYGGYSRVTTQPLVENMMTAHPDVDAIICQNDDSAIGAYAVLKKKGLNGKVLLAGGDGVPEYLDLMMRGEATCTFMHSGPWIGAAFAAQLFDSLHGVEWHPLERMLRFEGCVLNTPEAAEAYKKMTYTEDGGFNTAAFDYQKMSRHLHPDDWDMQLAIVPMPPDKFWAPYENMKPEGYVYPKVLADATSEDYAKIAAMYHEHLKVDPYDKLRKLSEPAPVEGYYAPGEEWHFVGAGAGAEERRLENYKKASRRT